MLPSVLHRRDAASGGSFTHTISSAPPGALEIVCAEARRFERAGEHGEARRLYERALHDGTATGAADSARLLRLIAGGFVHDLNHAAARDCAVAALAVAELAESLVEQGYATNILAVIECRHGNLDDAKQLYTRARALAHRAGEAKLAVMTGSNLGVIANVRGDESEARDAYLSALRDARAAGLPDQAMVALNNLGQLDMQAGRFDEANRHLVEARELSRVIGDRNAQLGVELLFTRLHLRQGHHVRAQSGCATAAMLIAQIGESREAGEAEHVYGLVARATGDLPAAEQHFLRAEAVAVKFEDLLLEGETARELADLYRADGRNRQTLQRLNQSHRIFAQLRARRELADVDRRTATLENDFLEVVRKWGESIESKDMYTQGHCVRVANLACALWQRVNSDDTSLFWFRIGALLHDVGKLMIPAEVLNKPGKLTDEEWAMMRGHPSAGVALLADIEFPWDVRPIVESHHERWDGRGYPHGLAGEAIPLTARVLGIADVYDALTSQRSYKRAFTHEEAMEIMRRDVGAQFDPALFLEFEAVVRNAHAAEPVPRRLTLVS
jgi:putative nucleotidyltransferase with HDIG domain